MPAKLLAIGATGFLDGQVVRQPFVQPGVTRVSCLVRAEDKIMTQKRIMEVTREGQW